MSRNEIELSSYLPCSFTICIAPKSTKSPRTIVYNKKVIYYVVPNR